MTMFIIADTIIGIDYGIGNSADARGDHLGDVHHRQH